MLTVKNIFSLALLLCLFVISPCSVANKNYEFILQKIAQTPPVENTSRSWVQLIEQPGNSQYYYLANDEGKIYQLAEGNPKHTVLMLDLQQLPLKKSFVKLTAFTLHPSFSLRGQEGYATFYTAHIEKSSANKTPRLRDKAINKPLAYDAVVTEWQLNLAKKVDSSKRREVLKVAMPTKKNGITQLSFNPYSKSWQDDYAQLYIALSQSPQLKKHPLYSGTVLRIKPQQVATRSYSVPHTNPFYGHGEIEQSIYLLGAGQITQLIWPDKYTNNLLISHQYRFHKTNRHWLSYSRGGEDWRHDSPEQFLYQSDQPVLANSLLVYRGQNAPILRNKLLLLLKDKKKWQIASLSSDVSTPEHIDNKTQKPLASPQLEWQLDQEALMAHQLTLHRDNRGELLFLNEDTGAIYQLFQTDAHEVIAESEQVNIGNIAFFFLVMLGLLGSYVFYQVNVQHKSAKSLVRRDFSTLVLSDDKLSLNLFRRHQKTIEKVIPLTDISQCQVFIGDLVITTINSTLNHGFNNKQDQSLREIFHTEQIAKMVDGKIRRINLVIKTNDDTKQVICLYLRKGSDRITKYNYFKVVDDVVDWCWLIANNINSEQVEQRAFKPKHTAADLAKAEHKNHDDTPLHKQAAIIRPAKRRKNHPNTQALETTAIEQSIEHLDEQGTVNKSDDITPDVRNDSESTKKVTDLPHALETIVKLHQQGYLSAEEFVLAKAELLGGVNSSD